METGFWIFMFCMNLLVPLIMIGFGSYFAKNPPKEINGLIGYRTTMSRKNQDTWEFAHRYSGRLWVKIGWVLLVLSAAAMFFVLGRPIGSVGIFGFILCCLQVVVLILSILPTERALRETFDENGRRRK